MKSHLSTHPPAAREGHARIANAELYYRDVGQGRLIMVVHGGPDFDHTYLLPDLDRLTDSFRLLYYDQRGRGRSMDGVRPEDVSMGSDVADLDALREHLQLESVALLGHSWGGLLAMEYALRHPNRVSHLILMNTAPASRDDFLFMRQERRRKTAADVEELTTRSSDPRYQEGDPDTVAEYYRVHFRATLRQPEHLERVITSLRRSFTKDSILKTRAIEDRLVDETWLASQYDLIPRLKQLDLPTLVIAGDHDLVPVECAAHIAEAIPAARFVLLRECGHFSYIEYPDEVRKEITAFVDPR